MPISRYVGKAVAEANSFQPAPAPVIRPANRPNRDQVVALYQAGHDFIEAWGWSTFGDDDRTRTIETNVLRTILEYPGTLEDEAREFWTTDYNTYL